jgi:hypothetical protein
MPSFAFQRWSGVRAAALDEIENAHRSVGGPGPGRRTATQQINHAYALLVSAQFQGFCRELHTEFAAHLVATVPDPNLRILFRSGFLLSRKLDRGNPNAGNIGSDFSRFNLAFWPLIDSHRPQNPQRRALLEELNEWRNAIAHQDFAPALLKGGRPALPLAQVQTWRKACEGLARSFDEVLRVQLQALTGTVPW